MTTTIRTNRLSVFAPVFLFELCVVAGAISNWAFAEVTLPYQSRTLGYSAWDTNVRGDLRTVGMAGAMVGLADSRIGAVDNPAGLAMTVDSTGLQISGSSVQDGYVQSFSEHIRTRSYMATGSFHPWGFSLTSWSPQNQGDVYRLSDGSLARLGTSTDEFRFSAARVMLGDRLSLGLTFILGENTQNLSPSGGASMSRSAWGFGAGIGALYQSSNRVLLGASFTPPIEYRMDASDGQSLVVPGFFQSARSPYRCSVGTGWVPNRFFRAGLALYLVGSTENAALLSDQTRLIGETMTLQPRAGFSYLLAEYKELTVELAAGTYVEVMRISGVPARWHGTFGLELNPWIFSFGWGLDQAREYKNFIFSGGIDVAKVLRKLELIPREKHYPRAGLLPNPTRLSDIGLPRALSKSWQEEGGRDPNPIDVGLEMPSKVRDHLFNAPAGFRRLGNDVFEAIEGLPGDIILEGGALMKRTGELLPGAAPWDGSLDSGVKDPEFRPD